MSRSKADDIWHGFGSSSRDSYRRCAPDESLPTVKFLDYGYEYEDSRTPFDDWPNPVKLKGRARTEDGVMPKGLIGRVVKEGDADNDVWFKSRGIFRVPKNLLEAN